MKILELYEEWVETGKLPKKGLCNSIPGGLNKLLWPDEGEVIQHKKETGWGHWDSEEDRPRGYWAASETDSQPDFPFSPLRQTLMLLHAALEGEL